ncbi:MAG: MFS transporter [Spirochaetia bacterium]|nr:MFS transporter [Spirochaetia bacterium]
MDKKSSVNRLQITLTLFTIASVLSDGFVNIYLWRTKGNFMPITTYMLACYLVIPVIFYLSGYICMRIDRVSVYRAGIFSFMAFYLMPLVFRENIADHVILWGIIKGVAMGFYWFGYHILAFDYTDTGTRDRFYSNVSIISGACALVGPVLSGFIIHRFPDYRGYYVVFAISAALYLAAIVMSGSMKSTPIKKPYKIEDLVFTKNKKWGGTMLAYLFLSGKDTIAMFLPGLLVFKATGSELTLGQYGMLIAGVTIAVAWLMGKRIKPENREKFVFTGAVLMPFITLILVLKLDFYGLLAYGILNAIADYFIKIPISAHALDVISLDANANVRKMEYIVARDMPIALARVVMMVVFILFIQYMPAWGIKAVFMLISVFPFGVWWAIYKKNAGQK